MRLYAQTPTLCCACVIVARAEKNHRLQLEAFALAKQQAGAWGCHGGFVATLLPDLEHVLHTAWVEQRCTHALPWAGLQASQAPITLGHFNIYHFEVASACSSMIGSVALMLPCMGAASALLAPQACWTLRAKTPCASPASRWWVPSLL